MVLTRYTPREEIEKAKQSPSFEREYNLKYLGRIGNVFHTKDIDVALEKGQTNFVAANKMSPKSMGIDPGWGSSPFAIVITQWVDGQIHVLYAEQFERPDFNEMLSIIWRLMTEFELSKKNSKIYVDGANPSVIKSLKLQLGENSNYDKVISYYNSQKWDWAKSMTVIPVNFSTEHKAMLGHVKMLVEKGYVSVNSKHDKLLTSLRTAVENEGVLDKEVTIYDDILDAFRLALRFYSFIEGNQ